MAKIIRADFAREDYIKMINEFLFSDSRISLPIEKLKAMKDRLLKAGSSFHKTFHAYFEFTDNKRYDRLCSREETLVKRIQRCNADLKGQEKKIFILFWQDIADIIEADYIELNVQYLKNSCRYFTYKIRELA